jgi:hypothetical protein
MILVVMVSVNICALKPGRTQGPPDFIFLNINDTHIILDIEWHIIYLLIQLIADLYYYLTYPSIKWITTCLTDIFSLN